MKRNLSKKKFLVFVLLIVLSLTVGFSRGIFAASDWEIVCSSSDVSTSGFFVDDFDVASDGTVYLIDSVLNEVAMFRAGSAAILLRDPSGDYSRLCLSRDDQTLFLLNTDTDTMAKYSPGTGNLETIDLYSAGATISVAVDIALAPNGDAYITDYAGNCIYVYTAGGSVYTLSDTGGAGELSAPCGIDINAYGKMAVALYERGQVVYTRSYDDQLMATNTTSAEGGAVRELLWTAIDDNNNVYLVDSETNRVVVLNAQTGAYKTLYPTSGDGESIRNICTIGNYLYICIGAADYSSFRIIRSAIQNEITAFSFQGIDATAEITNNAITITVPYDTDLATLKPDITVSEGTHISLTSGEPYDFTNPVVCTVESGVLGVRDYSVTDNSTYVNASEMFEFAEDEISIESDMTGFIILVTGYSLLLVLWIVLAFALRKRKKHKPFVILTIVWIVLGIVLVLIGLMLTQGEDPPLMIENAAYEAEDPLTYRLSEDQRAIIDEHGFPDSFVILYVDGGRQETWFYFEDGLVIDYLGGIELQQGYDADMTDYDVGKTVYTPDDFVFGMTPGAALSAAGVDSFVMEPLEDELVEDGVLYFGEGIVLGFVDDELYYVETILTED
jgi:WD40 repeat protein